MVNHNSHGNGLKNMNKPSSFCPYNPGRPSSRLLHTAMATAIACLVSASGAIAFCEQDHPFNALGILWYSVIAAPRVVKDVWVGGAAGIDQGAHGDCWFESALAGVARSFAGARLISDMIVGSSGGYQVTFLDDPTHHYPITQADITRAHVKDNAEWADIIEAGLVKRYPQLQNGKTGAHEVAQTFGMANNAFGLTLLTGHKAYFLKLNDTSEQQLAEILERNTFRQIPMTATTPQALPVQAVVTNHIYTIMAYDRAAQLITLRNPWGTNVSQEFPDLPKVGETKYGVRDLGSGVIQMRISTFTKYYSSIAWSRIFHL
jgi:Calpain family cysteine protease